MSDFVPRPGQKEALTYSGGKLGISAVPGSGKTRTLAELAAKLVAERIEGGQEVLVVTLVNSAVDNLKSRINVSIGNRGLLPGFGYRVRTLHGLAHDIVRERPGLVGLSEDFSIVDEREADLIREDAVETWLAANPDAAEAYLTPELDRRRLESAKRTRWPSLVRDIASTFIKRAKDLQTPPEVLLERLAGIEDAANFRLCRMGAEIYSDYQRSLAYRGAVDFDDLIRLALKALSSDAGFLGRLQDRWPYILEDEAQDSSQLQEEILRLLAARSGNWVRVGDPNQAIYETFTNADPRFLRAFLREPGVTQIHLRESGRSQPAIIDLANRLVTWAVQEHELPAGRGAFLEQPIRPTHAQDPQANPRRDTEGVRLIDRDLTPEQEIEAVADSLERFLPSHKSWTVAALVPRNQRGFELIDLLKKRQIPFVELLRSTSVTRHTAGALGNLLRCLADPSSARKLALACAVWRRHDRGPAAPASAEVHAVRLIKHCGTVESYLWPHRGNDWLDGLGAEVPEQVSALLQGFREVACRWHRAAVLPVDQLVLTLAGELFWEPAELALAHKLALLLRDVADTHPSYRLPELVEELAVIARNERRFLGLSGEESGFEPPPGEVTVATLHKAKGLEWDRVYLLSVNNYDFPSGSSDDTYVAERWFVRGRLNLEAEALHQLGIVCSLPWPVPSSPGAAETESRGLLLEGVATQQARFDYVAERLRLLYVGITRAKRDLFVTWNKGRQGAKLEAARPLRALMAYWREVGRVQGQPDE